jgi:hypothetical protein
MYNYFTILLLSFYRMSLCTLKVVGIEKLGGLGLLGVCLLIEKGTGPW